MNKENIILRPKFIYWLITSFKFILLLGLILFATYFFSEYPYVKEIALASTCIVFLILFYRYIDMIICTRWIITPEEIMIYKGVFSRTINHIELYRIFDYEEKKTFIQLLFANTTVLIYSQDKTSPILPLFGIKGKTDIIDRIRLRVEALKKTKGIYEFTNR